ncbi:hypothetical protein BC567DRAFT_140483, partial [Phyllosticta citribraziliensis]
NVMANSLPRQSPSPGPGHQPNGSGGMPNLVNGLLSGGHQTDMNHLWQVVQQLSDVLAENRSQTANIMNSVQQIQACAEPEQSSARAAQDGSPPTVAQVNGDISAANNRAQLAEINSLRTQLQAAQSKISSLESQNSALQGLVSDYESSVTAILEKLRPFTFRHEQAILALHSHYNTLLEKERQQNLELRLEHQEWQAGLGRAAQFARAALKESSEASLPHERKIKELKAENKLLRRLAGWEEVSDSDDEE